MIASPIVSGVVEGVGPVCNSFSEDNKAYGNTGVVESPSKSCSENAQEAAAKFETNVATSKNEGLIALPNVSSMVEKTKRCDTNDIVRERCTNDGSAGWNRHSRTQS
jgi:hypothetical protein